MHERSLVTALTNLPSGKSKVWVLIVPIKYKNIPHVSIYQTKEAAEKHAESWKHALTATDIVIREQVVNT